LAVEPIKVGLKYSTAIRPSTEAVAYSGVYELKIRTNAKEGKGDRRQENKSKGKK
jgi:hypothetical protein